MSLNTSALSILFLLIVTSAYTEEFSEMEALSLFNRASELYEEASSLPPTQGEQAIQIYKEASELYEQIIRQGFEHPDIYYNLGNTYYKLNNIGKAVLNYRRAQRFLTSNPDLLANIRSVKSKILDVEPDRKAPELLRTLFFWHFDTSIRFLAKGAFLCYLIFCLVISVYIFSKWGIFRFAGWGIGIVGLMLAISFGLRLYKDKTYRVAVVLADSAPIYTGYNENETERFTVHKGTELIVEEFRKLEEGERWIKIALNDELRGWIRNENVELIHSGGRP